MAPCLGALRIDHDIRLRVFTTLVAKAGIWIGLQVLIVLKIVTFSAVPHARWGIVLFNIAIWPFSIWLISGAVAVQRNVPVMMIFHSLWLVKASINRLGRALACSVITTVAATIS